MNLERKVQILDFLRRCHSESSQATNIAKFLGLKFAQDVLPLLRQMEFEGSVKKIGYLWQLSGAGSRTNQACGTGSAADTEVFLPTSTAANRSSGSAQTSGHVRFVGEQGLTDAVDRRRTTSRRASAPAERSRRRAGGIVNTDTYQVSCLTNYTE